jgi:hypothetical protein
MKQAAIHLIGLTLLVSPGALSGPLPPSRAEACGPVSSSMKKVNQAADVRLAKDQEWSNEMKLWWLRR